MALRFVDTDTDRLRISSSPPNYNAAYTVMGWMYVVASTGTWQSFWNIHSGVFSNEDWVGVNNTPTFEVGVFTGGTGSGQTGASASPLATWHHFAFVRASTTLATLYVDGASYATNSQTVVGRTASTTFDVGRQNATDDAANIRVTSMKAWTTNLSAADIAQEMRIVRPARLDSIYGWWPLFDPNDLTDWSGNGHGWTLTGTLGTEDGPPLSFGAAPWVILVPAASGGAAQDTPELYGRPYGARGADQMIQLMAQ